ncbi:MAG: NAD-dependent deacylase [Planctomycetes bacterium]|nr:NAD-dependent deacylase [Planctomycetota bacterium]MCB9905297.1 NAD-dependent deacylase [Planctomycetota bacterium]
MRSTRGAQRSLVVLTGAGVSADSGVPTFRDAGGLWEGHRVEEVATPEAWARDPRTVWRFYQLRRAALQEVEPNAAHLALARLERECAARGEGFTLISQNVDDLHERAGSTVLSMHGSLSHLACELCGNVILDTQSLDPDRFVPCGACGQEALRPDVVWFGELPRCLDEIDAALHGATHFLSIGTSGLVYPAAGLLSAARSLGAETWVNSLDPPENLHPRDRFHPGRAADVVPALVERWLAD